MNRALLVILLACLSCARIATDHLLNKNFHGWQEPFTVEPEDAGRIEQGWLPLLVLMDGKPCAKALTLVEPIPAGFHPYPESRIASTGLREDVLGQEAPGVQRTDARGIVWWQPSKEQALYRLSACLGERVGSYHLQQSRMEEFRAAARHGIAQQAIELLPMRTWKVEVLAPVELQPDDLPLFLASPEGRVMTRMVRSGARTASSFYLEDELMRKDDEFMQILAGFDRSQMQRVHSSRSSSIPAFDLRQTGGIAVDLITIDGGLVTEPRAVFLQEVEGAAASEWNGMASHLADAPSVVAVEGSAMLRGVPLGKRWRISAFTQGDHAAVMKEVDGPVRAGELKRVLLDAAESSVPFRGRILEPDGSPAASVDCRLKADGDVFAPIQTDAEGRFATRIPLWILNRGEEMRLQCDRWPMRPICSVRVSMTDLAAYTEQKDWQLIESETLAMGRVVDENGAGVGWATIYNSDSGGLSRCDGAGYFRLESEDDPPADQNLELEADSPWHLKESLSFRAGDRDLVVRVRTGARIAAVRANRALTPNIDWEFLLPDTAEAQRGGLHDWNGLRGAFEIGPVPPEATKVRVKFSSSSDLIGTVTLTDLQLVRGKVYKLPKPVQLDK